MRRPAVSGGAPGGGLGEPGKRRHARRAAAAAGGEASSVSGHGERRVGQ